MSEAVGKFGVLNSDWGSFRAVKVKRETAQFYWVDRDPEKDDPRKRDWREDKGDVVGLCATLAEASVKALRARQEWEGADLHVRSATAALREAKARQRELALAAAAGQQEGATA